jgi:hypothetical protein
MMIAIAVAASLIAYAWIMGYLNFTTTKAGKAVQIQNMAIDLGAEPDDPADDQLLVYVQNVGQGPVTIDSVYVNDMRKSFATVDKTLEKGETAALIVDYIVVEGERVTVKVVTSEGTFTQVTGKIGAGTVLMLSPALERFEFEPIDDQMVGVAFSITIRAVDQYGDLFVGYGGTNSLSSAGAGSIDPTSTGVFAFGVWSGSVTLSSVGSGVTISTSGGGKSGVSNEFDVGSVPAVLGGFEFDTIGSQTVVEAFGITIRAVDQFGAAFSFSGSGALSDLTGTIDPTGVTFTDGVATSSVTIGITRTADKITVNAGDKSGESNEFDVVAVPAVLDHFDFDTIASPKISGTAFSITITAKDQYDGVFTSYTGTNTLTYSGGSISPTTTTGGFAGGVWTGSVTVTGVGTGVTIRTEAQSDPAKFGVSNTFNVVAPGIPTTIEWFTGPSTVELGENWDVDFGILYRTDWWWFGGLNGKTISIVFTAPNSTEITRTVTTDWYWFLPGVFDYSFKPDAVGTWKVSARFDGDPTYGPSQVGPTTFTVSP